MFVVLITDYGDASYVGQVKGVISRISQNCKIIDLSHTIEKYNILEAGFTLYNSVKYFPENSIFLCIVDPGVGSKRKPIIIQTDKHIFIGPDNGLFTLILDKLKILNIIEIKNFENLDQTISNTFHGRDIFAPVAAKISMGNNVFEFGTNLSSKELIKNEFFYPKVDENTILGNVLYADSFGNLITNIHNKFLEGQKLSIEVSDFIIYKISNNFSDVEIGSIVAYIGSSSYLELAINQGNLANLIGYNSISQNLKNVNFQVKIVLLK